MYGQGNTYSTSMCIKICRLYLLNTVTLFLEVDGSRFNKLLVAGTATILPSAVLMNVCIGGVLAPPKFLATTGAGVTCAVFILISNIFPTDIGLVSFCAEATFVLLVDPSGLRNDSLPIAGTSCVIENTGNNVK